MTPKRHSLPVAGLFFHQPVPTEILSGANAFEISDIQEDETEV
jgi:hypothetical protein